MRAKLNYYFKKPKGSIAKDMILWIAAAGVIAIAATSPYFLINFLRAWDKKKKYNTKSARNTFQRLKNEGSLIVEKKGNAYYVKLTAKGKERAGWLQFDALTITKPNKWDGKWRLLMFDIEQNSRWKRDVLRSFLKRLGFALFQKSAWIHPYDCSAEVKVLNKLIGLTSNEIKLVVAQDIGDYEQLFLKKFHLAR